jgi:hypothetical protein
LDAEQFSPDRGNVHLLLLRGPHLKFFQIPSSAALVFTPFVMDQMQPMTQMAASSCPYSKPPLGSETDVLYYTTVTQSSEVDCCCFNSPYFLLL